MYEYNRRVFEVYPTRWYILAVHTLIGMAQVMVYSTWGPIQGSAAAGMGFTQTDFALLPNWYNTVYLIAVFPFMWLIQTKGLRVAEVTTAALIAVGAFTRCIGSTLTFQQIFVHLGHIINSIASPIPWIGCTYISAFWFPLNERPLATAVGLSSTLLGQAASFIIGPFFINYYAGDHKESSAAILSAIDKLLYAEFGFAVLVLVLVVVYFPAKPPTPPTYSATVSRTPLSKAMHEMSRSRQVWLTMIVYAVSSAVYLSWHQVLSVFVSPVMNEVEAGWVGFSISMVGIFAPPLLQIVAARYVARYPKELCLSFMIIGCVFFGYMLITASFIKTMFSPNVVWVCSVGAMAAWTVVEPIWWEMACEACYPVAESAVSGIFTFASCALSWFYFFLYMFPQLGTAWATWTVLIAEIAIIPIFLMYKPSFKRSVADQLQA